MLSSKVNVYNLGNTFYFKQNNIVNARKQTYTYQLLNLMGPVLEAWYKDAVWKNKGLGKY